MCDEGFGVPYNAGRAERLKQLCAQLSLDAIVLITGFDGCYNLESKVNICVGCFLLHAGISNRQQHTAPVVLLLRAVDHKLHERASQRPQLQPAHYIPDFDGNRGLWSGCATVHQHPQQTSGQQHWRRVCLWSCLMSWHGTWIRTPTA
jgi:hypothetical protein